ncbi:hypothetical protein ACIFQM_01175 [Paenibacillus sp. NRS-1782]|uniref:hypothetical protein n=1 Tax=unclassified Paenibacillus TaxID=185978 RepID=UPI003D287C9C
MGNKKKSMRDLVGKITQEGKVITFAQYVHELSGSEAIYREPDYFRKILTTALHAGESDSSDVVDILAPVVTEILLDTVQVDHKSYISIVESVIAAYDRMAAQTAREAAELSEHERNLIEHIRTLDFDDMLNVLDGIKAMAEDLSTKSILHASRNNAKTAQAFKSQAENMDKLEQLLGNANDEYRNDINMVPDDVSIKKGE